MPILLCLEERESKFMNYEKMWNDFKWHIAKEMENLERGCQYTSAHKDLLVHMSLMEASEYERVSAGCGEHPEPDENDGRKEPEEKTDQNQGADRKPEPKEILRKIFGGDYTDSLSDLGKKMMEKGRKLIVVDSDVVLTSHILNAARERGITIMQCSFREAKLAHPFDLPIFRTII